MSRRRELTCLLAILAATVALRIVRLDQPIVENYVGRQIPTAMVARNLDRGSGFLRPQLDTGPFPNLFLVEPPIYAGAVVVVRRLTSLPIASSGRLASALATALAAWALFGLVRNREGTSVALASTAAFCALPLTIRYGRAVQPDMMMLATIVLGLRMLDRHEREQRIESFSFAWIALAFGLAIKILAAWVLAPAWIAIQGLGRWKRRALIASTLLPALAWYVHAARIIASGEGSRASADNGAVWLSVLVPSALIRLETYQTVARFVFWRSFSPAWPLAAWGFWQIRNERRFWWTWAAAASAALMALAGKLHHEYYLLGVAPLVALGFGRALVDVRGRFGGLTAAPVSAGLLGLSLFVTRSTWTTPDEWRPIAPAGTEIRRYVPPEKLLVATEALLFASDRRGCRLEFSERSVRRAAGEWGETMKIDTPEGLVEFYRTQGAGYVADLTFPDESTAHAAFHDWIRRTYPVIVDRPGLLLAELKTRRRPWRRGQAVKDSEVSISFSTDRDSESPHGGTDAEK